VEIYDTLTRRIVARRCIGIPKPGVVPTFNHAGDLLVTNDWTSIRRLWDPASGTELLHMAAYEKNFFLISPDDRKAAVSIEGQDLQTLRIAMGAERTFAAAPMKNGEANEYGDQITPSPDGRILAIGSSAGVSLVDSQSGFEVAVVPDREPIQFDGSGALLTCGPNGFHRWPMQSESKGRIVHVKSPESQFSDVRVTAAYSASQDGSVVAMATPFSETGAFVMHQAKAGGEVRRVVAGPQHDVRHCAVSPDGKWVATGSFSPAPERLTNARVWNSATGEPVKTLPVSEGVLVWFSPRGRWLATVSRTDGECRLWRTGSWEAGPRFPSAIEVAFSPDERMLALGGKAGQIQLCETESGREIGILPATAGAPASPRCFSPDGTRLYAKVEWDSKVHVWDLRRIRDGLREMGLDQEWPEFPPRQVDDNAPPPVVEVEAVTPPSGGVAFSPLGPACVPTGRLTSIDLQAKANIGLTESFEAAGGPNNLAELPQGEQVLAGVKFTIGKSLIQLDDTHLSEKLRKGKAEAISVDKTFSRLYILHGTQWGYGDDGTLIGQYRVHYQDGTVAAIPIVLGEDVRDWWNVDRSEAVTRGIVAWAGQNGVTRQGNVTLRLYLAVWDNPHPEKKVVSIDFLRDGPTVAGPFCVAMTVEEPAVGKTR
jgi:WD40 repeat protein